MPYCQKCGGKVEIEDQFCTSCGMRLNEDSPQEKKQFSQDEQFIEYKDTHKSNVESNKHESTNYSRSLNNQSGFSDVGHILIKMFLKPVQGAKQFVEKSEKASVIAITLILAVIQGFIGIWKVNQVTSSLQNVAISFIQQMAGMINLIEPGATNSLLNSNEIMDITSEINKFKSFISIPYGKIFLQNIAMFLIAIAILFIIIYCGTNILSKNKNKAFTTYKTALIVSAPTLYFEILSVVFSYLSFFIGIGVAVIGVIVSLACLTIVIKDELDINENHCTFIVAISFIAIFIGISMCLQKFIVSNISDIIMSVTNVMKTLK